MQRERGIHRSPGGPGAAPRALAVTAAVLVVLVGAPSGVARPTWSGSSVSSTTSSGAGCASHVALVATAWNVSGGRGSLGERETAGPCGSGPPSTWVSSNASWSTYWEAYVLLPRMLPYSTTYVNASWTFNWTATTTYSVNRSCNGTLAVNATYGVLTCSVDAAVAWESIDALWDATANRYYGTATPLFPSLYNSSSLLRTTTCAPKCTHYRSATGVQGTVSGTRNVTYRFVLSSPNPSHAWYLVALTAASAYCSVSTASVGFTGVVPMQASARDALDMGRGTDGAFLRSIVVT